MSRNAKFLENGVVSKSDQNLISFSENDHLSEKLIVTYSAPRTVIVHPIIETLKIANNNPIDPIFQQLLENVEQPIAKHVPHEDDDTTLRRSTRIRKAAILSDFFIYL